MKATVTALCLSGVLGLALAVAAQEPPSHKMTVTGCLREATGTPGEYELTNAKSAKATTTSTYRLTAGASVNLKEHVGHKVEISGEMKGGHEAGAPEKSPTTAGTEHKINVTSLKHISATCEAGTTK